MRRTLSAILLAVLLLLPGTATLAQDLPDFTAIIDTEDVMAHVRALSVAIGARPMGSEAEARAAEYIAAALRDWGYEVEMQTFEFDSGGSVATSRNVIATRPGDGSPVVIGAHFDSADVGAGAGDNASGVAVMLAVAEALRDVELVHPVVFVAFGAEEGGLFGSDAYVDQLGDEASDILAMLNIDSVGVGTTLYVYAGAVITWPHDDSEPEIDGGPVWVRDLALDLAAEMNMDVFTTPSHPWNGYIGDWSDHYPFVEAGVPVAYFEAWLWDGDVDPWWGQETPEGDVMHTRADVYEAVKPAQVEQVAELVAATAAAIASGSAAPQ
jgi:alkaline phosphatase isozyme conversion protein